MQEEMFFQAWLFLSNAGMVTALRSCVRIGESKRAIRLFEGEDTLRSCNSNRIDKGAPLAVASRLGLNIRQ